MKKSINLRFIGLFVLLAPFINYGIGEPESEYYQARERFSSQSDDTESQKMRREFNEFHDRNHNNPIRHNPDTETNISSLNYSDLKAKIDSFTDSDLKNLAQNLPENLTNEEKEDFVDKVTKILFEEKINLEKKGSESTKIRSFITSLPENYAKKSFRTYITEKITSSEDEEKLSNFINDVPQTYPNGDKITFDNDPANKNRLKEFFEKQGEDVLTKLDKQMKERNYNTKLSYLYDIVSEALNDQASSSSDTGTNISSLSYSDLKAKIDSFTDSDLKNLAQNLPENLTNEEKENFVDKVTKILFEEKINLEKKGSESTKIGSFITSLPEKYAKKSFRIYITEKITSSEDEELDNFINDAPQRYPNGDKITFDNDPANKNRLKEFFEKQGEDVLTKLDKQMKERNYNTKLSYLYDIVSEALNDQASSSSDTSSSK